MDRAREIGGDRRRSTELDSTRWALTCTVCDQSRGRVPRAAVPSPGRRRPRRRLAAACSARTTSRRTRSSGGRARTTWRRSSGSHARTTLPERGSGHTRARGAHNRDSSRRAPTSSCVGSRSGRTSAPGCACRYPRCPRSTEASPGARAAREGAIHSSQQQSAAPTSNRAHRWQSNRSRANSATINHNRRRSAPVTCSSNRSTSAALCASST